jgi:iron-sulfur cluster assembly accessory protein
MSADIAETVTITDRAAKRISRILAGENSARALRVSVEGGGCSGFSYKFDFAEGPEGDDFVIEHNGATVVIDQTSLPFMAGSQIDFVDDLMGQSFQVRNPNATASCGCGTSFAL